MNIGARRFPLTLLLSTLLLANSLNALAENPTSSMVGERQSIANIFHVPTFDNTSFPFTGVEILTPAGQLLRYYSSDISTQKKPLVIFLPGSGCNGAFINGPNGHRITGAEAFALHLSETVRLIVVENPGIEKRFSIDSNVGCSSMFKKMENMQARLQAFQIIVNDLRLRGWVDNFFMIFASSEGVSLATRFATISNEVSHLLLVSGFGMGQPLATVHAALTEWGNWSFVPTSGPQGHLAGR